MKLFIPGSSWIPGGLGITLRGYGLGWLPLLTGAVAFLLAWLLLPAAIGVLERPGLTQANFRGRPLTRGAGLAVLLASLAATAIPGLPGLMGRTPVPGTPDGGDLYVFLFGAALVGMVGLLDDLAGDGAARGLSGHLRQLGSGQVTTGLLKLLFIALAAITVGSVAARFSAGANPYLGPYWLGLMATVNAVAIAGTANLTNLLDLRPGRSIKAFLVLGLVYFVLSRSPVHGYFLAAPLGAALAVLPAELGERAMLGDVGANFLGFALGAAVAFDLPTAPKLVYVVVVVLANLAAERVSLGRLIEANAVSGFLDRLGRRPER
ncbi:MAG: hypothetical protein ACYC6V_01620 [Bacillota bacterium]